MVRARSRWVAGVDGCRSGWVAVLRDDRSGAIRARLLPDFAAVLALPEAPIAIAVDMPIGLDAAARPGGRACDRLARALLGPRRASLFSAPTRPALAAFRAGRAYAAVSRANRGGDRAAPALSRQAFHLLRRIDELDRALLARRGGPPVVEAHPELSFAAANGGRPMRHPKRTAPGRRERERLLAALGWRRPAALLAPRPAGVHADDVLDACILCWSARRVAAATALALPPDGPRDAAGLAMAIWR